MMTVEELKKEGAIYFEKVTDGMQQYENRTACLPFIHQLLCSPHMFRIKVLR